MKNKIICLCLFFAGVAMLSGIAEAEKIGYIEINRIVEESKQGKEKREALEKVLLKKKEEGRVMENHINEMKKEYTEKELNLSEEAKMQMEENMQNEVVKLQRLAKDSKAYLQKLEMRSRKELLYIISTTVKKFGKDNGYSMILNYVEPIILYANTGLDVTGKIIELLNKQ